MRKCGTWNLHALVYAWSITRSMFRRKQKRKELCFFVSCAFNIIMRRKETPFLLFHVLPCFGSIKRLKGSPLFWSWVLGVCSRRGGWKAHLMCWVLVASFVRWPGHVTSCSPSEEGWGLGEKREAPRQQSHVYVKWGHLFPIHVERGVVLFVAYTRHAGTLTREAKARAQHAEQCVGAWR